MSILTEKIDQIENNLIAYLRDQLKDLRIGYEEPLTPLEGGCETHMYCFKLSGAQKELSIRLVLRLYPHFYGTRNVVREKTVQNVLAGEGFPVARTFFICSDIAILGGSFFIMEFIDGNPMLAAPLKTIPDMLGKTHAALHKLKPASLINSLYEQGIRDFRLTNNLDVLYDKGNKYTWLRSGIEWLRENRPDEKEHLVICHGDFHYLNILITDKKVSGIIDWSSFLIADPVLDIANTIVIITMVSKHLLPSAIKSFSSVNWEVFSENYLSAYQMENTSLDIKHLSYYMVRRCFEAIIQGVEGQKVLQHPLIIQDMIKYIGNVTGICISVPDYKNKEFEEHDT